MPDLDITPAGTEAVLTPPPVELVPADDFDKDRAMATITKLREFERDAKAKIKRLAELEAAEAARATADLSENDRLKKQLATLQAEKDAAHARLQSELIKSAAASAATALQLPFAGTTALDDAVALGAFAHLDIGDDGKVDGVNDAIKALHKARPYLFGQNSAQRDAPDINAGARGGGSQSKDDIDNANRRRLAARAGRF